jgi:hypothetical protein
LQGTGGTQLPAARRVPLTKEDGHGGAPRPVAFRTAPGLTMRSFVRRPAQPARSPV